MSTMLVHVKEPRTEIRLTGPGAEETLGKLKEIYPDLLVEQGEEQSDSDDDEFVDIRDTQWYGEQQLRMTQGRRLRVYRDNAGLTLTALADKSGIPKGNLSLIEADKRPLGSRTAKRLAAALACDYRALL